MIVALELTEQNEMQEDSTHTKNTHLVNFGEGDEDKTLFSLVKKFRQKQIQYEAFHTEGGFHINKAKHCPHTVNCWSTVITESTLTENIHRPFQEL